MHRRAAFSLLVLGSLARVALGQRPSDAPAATEREVEIAVRRAGAALDSAFLDGDTARIRRAFADGAYFVRARGDTVRGSAAIASAMSDYTYGEATHAAVILYVRDRELCSTGGWDVGMYGIQQVQRDASRVSGETGTYVLQWQYAAGSGARVSALTFVAGDEAPARTRGVARCHRYADDRYDRKRIYVSGFLPGVGVSSATTSADAGRAMSAFGWTSPGARFVDVGRNPEYLPYHSDQASFNNIVRAAVRLRVWHALALEGTYQPIADQGSVSRQKSADNEYAARFDERESDAFLSYEWRRVRLGLGAARVTANWRELDFYATYVTQGTNTLRYENEQAGRESLSATGMAVQLAYSQPLAGPLFVEAAGHLRRGLRATVPGRPGYGEWTAKFDGTWFGVGAGLAF